MSVDDECRIRNHRVARPRPRRAVDLARARSFARFSFCRSRASRRRPRASTRSRDAIVASRSDASAPSRHLGVPTFFRRDGRTATAAFARTNLQENSIFFLARNFERGEGAVGGDDGVRPRVGGAPRARARRNGVGADDAAGYGANAASSVRA